MNRVTTTTNNEITINVREDTPVLSETHPQTCIGKLRGRDVVQKTAPVISFLVSVAGGATALKNYNRQDQLLVFVLGLIGLAGGLYTTLILCILGPRRKLEDEVRNVRSVTNSLHKTENEIRRDTISLGDVSHEIRETLSHEVAVETSHLEKIDGDIATVDSLTKRLSALQDLFEQTQKIFETWNTSTKLLQNSLQNNSINDQMDLISEQIKTLVLDEKLFLPKEQTFLTELKESLSTFQSSWRSLLDNVQEMLTTFNEHEGTTELHLKEAQDEIVRLQQEIERLSTVESKFQANLEEYKHLQDQCADLMKQLSQYLTVNE